MPRPNEEIIRRFENNPILSTDDIPYPATLIFNAGVTKFNGRYVMMFRNDWGDFHTGQGDHGTNLGLAYSDDGISWAVEPQPCRVLQGPDILRTYDPRLTVIDGRLYLCFAVDTPYGIRGGIAVTDNLKDFEILNLTTPDNRNMVLFPEKVNGKFIRLERPFPMYGRNGDIFDIWYSDSPDGQYWGSTQLLLAAKQVPWCNNKIGPAAPPIRTSKGWLALIHVVDNQPDRILDGWEKHPWTKRYSAGLVLMDINKPWKIIGMSSKPVIVPEANYEVNGFRGSVIFPGGMIVEPDDEVKIYYGAADTVEALAFTTVNDLLKQIDIEI